MSMTVFSVG